MRVRRLGSEWTDKKAICNKFSQSAAVTCVAWPTGRPHDVLVGCADGQLRICSVSRSKATSVYSHPGAEALSLLCSNVAGTLAASAHVDGVLHVVDLGVKEQESHQGVRDKQLLRHHCPPTAMVWARTLLVAGTDCKVSCRGAGPCLTAEPGCQDGRVCHM